MWMRILKLWSVLSRSQRFTLRSSAERYVQSSLFTEMELMWYVCAFAKILLGIASIEMSSWTFTGILSCVIDSSSLNMPSSVTVLRLLYLRHRSEIFHSFTVLSGGIGGRKERGKKGEDGEKREKNGGEEKVRGRGRGRIKGGGERCWKRS